MADPVRIEGLREFNRSLKDLDADLPKAVRLAFNTAADIVVEDAKPRVVRDTGRAKRSVRARSTRTKSRIVGGGAKAPHYPWLDFGGRVGRNRSVRRPYLKQGRYIYKAFYDNERRYVEVMADALTDVARQAGLVVE